MKSATGYPIPKATPATNEKTSLLQFQGCVLEVQAFADFVSTGNFCCSRLFHPTAIWLTHVCSLEEYP
jgi:hypothetical protein